MDSWSFDDVLCINGEIGTKMLVDIENVEWTAVDTVIVDSGGGDVAIAIQIAEKIASQKITLVVRGRCLSSCANYLFIAASLKIVLKDSKIGWHGGPGTAEDYGISDPARAEKINSIRKLSDDFLTKMGVSTEILYSAPQWAVSEGERRKSLGADLRSFTWSYNAEELLRRFNVKNVLFER
ncbi:MAG TPA: hypothetical protein VED40_02555 [Azospirillaceae bacterium]|nr:hypothetical protein [Azospirillaceae bacterium]